MKHLATESAGELSRPAAPPRQRGVATPCDHYHTRQLQTEIPQRILDITTSLALLVLVCPLMLLASLLIVIDSRGPVLYRQVRTGRHGRPFVLLKFRSMVVNAEDTSGPCWAQRQDSRITRAGKFLRRTRTDELPQLLNVLRGHMSMVGPRPERPHFVEQLSLAIPRYQERTAVKPGITGWAQVNYPYGASVQDAEAKLTYDLYYIANRNLLFDIRILLATVSVVLLGRGAR